MPRNAQPQRSLLVSTDKHQRDPIGTPAKFLLRAAAHLDVREQVLMTYLVYFRTSPGAQRARTVAAQAGWRVSLFAVPEAYVLRLARRRLLTDGRIEAERDEVIQISAAYDGDWRHVMLEQADDVGAWERLAEQVASQETPTPVQVPAQRAGSASEATRTSGAAG